MPKNSSGWMFHGLPERTSNSMVLWLLRAFNCAASGVCGRMLRTAGRTIRLNSPVSLGSVGTTPTVSTSNSERLMLVGGLKP